MIEIASKISMRCATYRPSIVASQPRPAPSGGLVDMVWLAGGATVCIDGAYFDTLSSGKAARGEGERRVLCVTFRHLLRKSKRLFDLSVYCDPLPVAKE